jgi:hypothetical protein
MVAKNLNLNEHFSQPLSSLSTPSKGLIVLDSASSLTFAVEVLSESRLQSAPVIQVHSEPTSWQNFTSVIDMVRGVVQRYLEYISSVFRDPSIWGWTFSLTCTHCQVAIVEFVLEKAQSANKDALCGLTEFMKEMAIFDSANIKDVIGQYFLALRLIFLLSLAAWLFAQWILGSWWACCLFVDHRYIAE